MGRRRCQRDGAWVWRRGGQWWDALAGGPAGEESRHGQQSASSCRIFAAGFDSPAQGWEKFTTRTVTREPKLLRCQWAFAGHTVLTFWQTSPTYFQAAARGLAVYFRVASSPVHRSKFSRFFVRNLLHAVCCLTAHFRLAA